MDFKASIVKKYPHLSQDTELVSAIVDKAKMFYYALRYPCEPYVDETSKPIDTFIGQNWVLSACDELIERLGFNSAVAYKENGVSWSFDGAQLSTKLCSLIKPTIGVV
jgi:hypothetical protein